MINIFQFQLFGEMHLTLCTGMCGARNLLGLMKKDTRLGELSAMDACVKNQLQGSAFYTIQKIAQCLSIRMAYVRE